MNIFSELNFETFTLLLSAFALLMGSFFNVLIARLPIMMERAEQMYFAQMNGQNTDAELNKPFNLLTPASHCPKCKAKVRWWMNIPIISFVCLRAKCASCKHPISWQYPIVEILSATIAYTCAQYYGQTTTAIAMCVFLWALLCLTVIDLNTQLLPDIITLPLLWLGILFNLTFNYVTIQSSIWGVIIGYLSLWSIYWLFKLLTGKEGMGYGDFKLFAALGAWLGIGMLLPIILFASISGAIVGILLIAFKKHSLAQSIAFGPYLAIGGVLSLFYGSTIVSKYLAYITV